MLGVPGKYAELKQGGNDRFFQVLLVPCRQTVGYAQGNGLFNRPSTTLQRLAQPGPGVVFHRGGRAVFSFHNNRETAGVTDHDVRLEPGAFLQHPCLLDPDAVMPAWMLPPDNATQRHVEGRFGDFRLHVPSSC